MVALVESVLILACLCVVSILQGCGKASSSDAGFLSDRGPESTTTTTTIVTNSKLWTTCVEEVSSMGNSSLDEISSREPCKSVDKQLLAGMVVMSRMAAGEYNVSANDVFEGADLQEVDEIPRAAVASSLRPANTIILNDQGSNPIVVFLHGGGQQCAPGLQPNSGWVAMFNRFQAAGWCVMADCGNDAGGSLDFFSQLGSFLATPGWANQAFENAQRFGSGRKIGVLGYSMGGGGAISISARFNRGDIPIIAAHPAPLLSFRFFAPPKGPLLYTAGTLDTPERHGARGWFTNPAWIRWSFIQTWFAKAFVNFIGIDHNGPQSSHVQHNAFVDFFDMFFKGSVNGHAFKANYCPHAEAHTCAVEF